MENNELRLVKLHHCRGIGWKSIQIILNEDPALSRIHHKKQNEWQELLPHLTPRQLTLFYKDLQTIDISRKLQNYLDNGITVYTVCNERYPARLRYIDAPPWVLYAKGDNSLFHGVKMIAVVGPRKPSPYGKEALHLLLPSLIEQGYTIVSGLASGIDTLAHETAISCSGRTIAVLGGGLLQVYPKANIPLALQMMKEQLVISETIPLGRPEAWMFPMRNRIISGLTDGLLILEAEEKSGTLITAYHALDQGKEVFAVPGNITSPYSKGTNRLIQDGAKAVLSTDDIIEEMRSFPLA